MPSMRAVRLGIALAVPSSSFGVFVDSAWAGPVEARVEIRPISAAGVFGMPTDEVTVPVGVASYTLAVIYEVLDVDYLILLSGGSGDFTVLELDDTGNVVQEVQHGEVEGTGWRGMGVGSDTRGPYLYLAKPADGRMRTFPLLPDGRVDLAGVVEQGTPQLRHKNVFDVYDQSGGHMYGLDTFEGAGAAYRVASPSAVVGTEVLSPGWTSVDHIDVDGQIYRVVYKEAGDPFTSFGQSPTEEGRTMIVPIDATGTVAGLHYDDVLVSGFQLVRFVQVDAATYAFLLYERGGLTMLRSFDPYLTAGTGAVMNVVTTGNAYDEVLTYRRNGQTYMVGVELEAAVPNAAKLTQDQMGRLAECVHMNLGHRTVGYQLSVAQAGRQLLSRAFGYQRLWPSSAEMTRDTVINLGSVGKLMTTISAYALAEQDMLDLNASITGQLDPSEFPSLDPWTSSRAPIDLMLQVTGYTDDTTPGCVELSSLEVDCDDFFSKGFENALCDEALPLSFPKCPRDYVNTHFTALRVLNQTALGVDTTPDLDQALKDLWIDEVSLGGPSCLDDMESKYFKLCHVGETCYTFGAEQYYQWDPIRVNGWSINCGSAGWQASADAMVAVLEALEGRGILSPAGTNAILNTGYQDVGGKATAAGFEPPYVARSGGGLVLGKNGAGATSSFATMLDANAQATLSINTKRGSPLAQDVFVAAYDYATGGTPTCTPMMEFSERDALTTGHVASDVAIDQLPGASRFVVATRGAAGQVEVATYNRVGHSVQEDAWITTSSGDSVELLGLSSTRFVTSMRDVGSDRLLSTYRVSGSGTITLDDTEVLAPKKHLKIAKVSGVDAELVTAALDNANKLNVVAWDIAPNGTLVQRGSYVSADTFVEVAVSHTPTDGRVLVATRDNLGRVRPLVFDLSADALTVTRTGGAQPAAAPVGSDIRLVHVQMQDFTSFYVTTYRSSGMLAQTSWQIGPGGLSVVPIDSALGGSATKMGKLPRSLMSPYYVVPLIDDEDRARPMGMRITGTAILASDQPEIGKAQQIAMLHQWSNGRDWATAALIDMNGKLRIVNLEAMSGPP